MADEVVTQQDLVAFVLALLEDCEANADEWEKSDLAAFLEAMAAWIDGVDRHYVREGLDMSSLTPWRLIADMLAAARIHE